MKQTHISPIFLSNGVSSTLVIPREMAKHMKIDQPCHVTLQEKNEGIFIKKLKV